MSGASYVTLLRKIEERYGSVCKCPEDDPQLISMRELIKETETKSNRHGKLGKRSFYKMDFALIKELRDLRKEGYKMEQIGDETGVDVATINILFRKYGIKRYDVVTAHLLKTGCYKHGSSFGNLADIVSKEKGYEFVKRSTLERLFRKPDGFNSDKIRVTRKVKFEAPSDEMLKKLIFDEVSKSKKYKTVEEVIEKLTEINGGGVFTYGKEAKWTRG